MNNEPRWYVLGDDGSAMLCVGEEDAREHVHFCNVEHPLTAPHRAAQLVEADELDRLRARVAELEAERADDDALRERMSDILKRTAIALRGQEPPLTAWSWHDLPERADAAIASIDLFQRVAHNLADPPAPAVDVDAISDDQIDAAMAKDGAQ